jgi:GH15 family glucan-1,4-alpha-glucosidase
MMDLVTRSKEIILANQAPSGAYVACPTFPHYQYCWFRDSAFTAYAMQLSGECGSADRFYQWAVDSILQREELIRAAVSKARSGQPLGGGDILHTRYRLDGAESSDHEWPNFQLDGFGTWLWGLERRISQAQSAPRPDWIKAAGLVADYLSELWSMPCYDCWEENVERVHPYTLAAIYAGLKACSTLDGIDRTRTLSAISDLLQSQAVLEGRFVKFIGSATVDASLLGLSVPYRVVAPSDPRMIETVVWIEKLLRRGGGVHRYPTDTYYGGGEWVLLTAWLGWYYTEVGELERAAELLAWIESQADADGRLPEQTAATLNDPGTLKPWEDNWGLSARPLVWSHAQYLILKAALQKKTEMQPAKI